MPPQTLLTIAGFDPSSGAGITADLAVFAAHGFFGTSAITALTVQSTCGVQQTQPVEAGLLAAMIKALDDDLPPAGIKIGMLANAAIARVVTDYLRGLREQGRRIPVVLDPVLRSSSGHALLDEEGLVSLKSGLIPVVDWMTPNTAELAVLTGLPVRDRAEVEHAAQDLLRRFPGLHLVVTGGDALAANDLLATPDGFTWFAGERIDSTSTHGTGCAFSSALLANLVAGLSHAEAVHEAKTYVTEAIRSAPGVGHGRGPMNLLWLLKEGT